MTRHTSRSNKKNKSRSRKQHGGFLGDFFSGIGNKFKELFGPKPSDTANTSVATIAPAPAPASVLDAKTQNGGAKKKTKKHHHHRHRK